MIMNLFTQICTHPSPPRTSSHLKDLSLSVSHIFRSLTPRRNDERLLVGQVLRRHLEVAAQEHGHVGQVEGPPHRDVRAVMLHRPAGRGLFGRRGELQLLEEGLVAQLLYHAFLAEAR